jgi:hypothetical protein
MIEVAEDAMEAVEDRDELTTQVRQQQSDVNETNIQNDSPGNI